MKRTREPKAYLSELEIFKEYSNKYNVSRKEFLTILNTFNHLLMTSIIETGKLYDLPSGLGNIGILKKTPPDKAKFDFELYKQTGQKLYTKNLHSDGMVAMYVWNVSKSYSSLPSSIKGVWTWTPTREYKRLLAKKIIEDNYINKYFNLYDY